MSATVSSAPSTGLTRRQFGVAAAAAAAAAIVGTTPRTARAGETRSIPVVGGPQVDPSSGIGVALAAAAAGGAVVLRPGTADADIVVVPSYETSAATATRVTAQAAAPRLLVRGDLRQPVPPTLEELVQALDTTRSGVSGSPWSPAWVLLAASFATDLDAYNQETALAVQLRRGYEFVASLRTRNTEGAPAADRDEAVLRLTTGRAAFLVDDAAFVPDVRERARASGFSVLADDLPMGPSGRAALGMNGVDLATGRPELADLVRSIAREAGGGPGQPVADDISLFAPLRSPQPASAPAADVARTLDTARTGLSEEGWSAP